MRASMTLLRDDSGAVSSDWTVLVAVSAVIALVVLTPLVSGTATIAEGVADAFDQAEVAVLDLSQ